MNERRNCERCGAVLPAGGALGTVCPRCLMQLGMEAIGRGPGGRAATPTVEEVQALLPQFEVLEFVGRGGMGAVYKARQKSLGRLVALKVLLPREGHEADFADRFGREARALAGLAHPGLVAIHDFGQAGDFYYLVMEYVDGPSLRNVIASGHCGTTQALALVAQICEALQAAHEQGVVHRDIKPENILVDRQGRIKISDFGLAKLLDPDTAEPTLTRDDQVMGTPHYMAPEQVEHPKQVDHRADIYSLGVVFYELLTGELPLGNFPTPSRKVEVDVRLDEVVLRALEKEPSRRYQSAAHVRTDLDQIRGDGDTSAHGKQSRGVGAEVRGALREVEEALGEVKDSLRLPVLENLDDDDCRVIVVGGALPALKVLGVLLAVAAVLAAVYFLRSSGTSTARAFPMFDQEGAIQNQAFYDDRGIDPIQQASFDETYHEAWTEYVRLLREATVGRVDEDGTIQLEIRGFPVERERLEVEMYEKLSWMLTFNQMGWLRSDRFAEEAFPYGSTPVHVEIPSPEQNRPCVETQAGQTRLIAADGSSWMRTLWQKAYPPAPSVLPGTRQILDWFEERAFEDVQLQMLRVSLNDDARGAGEIVAFLELVLEEPLPKNRDQAESRVQMSLRTLFNVREVSVAPDLRQVVFELVLPTLPPQEDWDESCEAEWDPLERVAQASRKHDVALRQVETMVRQRLAHLVDHGYRVQTSLLEPVEAEPALSLLADLEASSYWASVTSVRLEAMGERLTEGGARCDAVLNVRSGR